MKNVLALNRGLPDSLSVASDLRPAEPPSEPAR